MSFVGNQSQWNSDSNAETLEENIFVDWCDRFWYHTDLGPSVSSVDATFDDVHPIRHSRRISEEEETIEKETNEVMGKETEADSERE